MITAEIKINGTLLGHMYAVNVGIDIESGNFVVCKYDYEYYRVGKGEVVTGSLTHKRSDGPEKLIGLLMIAVT